MLKHDAITAESTRADAGAACVNLERQYRRLYFLEKLNIIIKACKRGGGEQQIYMTDEQIQRNLDLRAEENAPMIEGWKTTTQTLISFKMPPTIKSSSWRVGFASSSSGPRGPPLPPPPRRHPDASSSDESPEPSPLPGPPPPAPGTVIAARPTAKPAPPAVIPTPAAVGPT